MHELFRCLAHDCNYLDEKLCDVSKADCIALDYILLSKLISSWRFLKFSETFMYAITSHRKRREKYQTEMYHESWNNILTVDTDDQKFNCDNADGHSQTGNRKNNVGKLNSTSRKNKGNRSALRLCLHTIVEHLFTQTLFYCGSCGFDKYKVSDIKFS